MKKIPNALDGILLQRRVDVEEWFQERWTKMHPSFYGSVDLRDAGFKVAPVDTNLFPAGFNNLAIEYKPFYVDVIKRTIQTLYEYDGRHNILIVPESHTRNEFYLENLYTLQELFETAGFVTKIGSLREDLKSKEQYILTKGRKLTIYPLQRIGNQIQVENFLPDLVVLNNDLSSGIPNVLQNPHQKIIPCMQLGWFNRLKSEHFGYLESVVKEFSERFSVDSWLLQPYFEYCHDISFSGEKNLDCLVAHAEDLLMMINKKYTDYGIKEEPFLVVKADTGTYGMAVLIIKEPEELYKLNRKQKNKMTYTKGGQPVSRAIIQEGVYSINKQAKTGYTTEPVVYLIGSEVIGGFYRGHQTKTSISNLNTKGMFFSTFNKNEMEALLQAPSHNAYTKSFYLYSVTARLAMLAASYELNSLMELTHDN